MSEIFHTKVMNLNLVTMELSKPVEISCQGWMKEKEYRNKMVKCCDKDEIK